MTLEMQWMVKLLDAYINKIDITLPSSCSAEKLYEAGKKHSVLPILFQVLCRQGSDCKDDSGEVMGLFKEAYISAVYLASLQDYSLEEVGEKLEERGIGYVPVKGAVIKKLYPEPELRTMGDLDLLIQEKNRRAADEVMKSLGYEKEELGNHVWTYKKGLISFEIHGNLAGGTYWNQVDYIGYFSDFFGKSCPEKGTSRGLLKLEDHFLYLCFHLAKHLCSTGAGIRMILDIALYVKGYDEEMDWQYIWREAEKLRLKEFIESMLFIVREWFHVETTAPVKKMDPRTQAVFEEYVLSGGVFGFEREDSIRRLRKGIREDGSNRNLLVKVRALLYLAFPNREHMKAFLPALEKYPVLLPAAWVKRWRLGFGNKERVKKSLENFSGNVEEAKSQWELLKKIGLS